MQYDDAFFFTENVCKHCSRAYGFLGVWNPFGYSILVLEFYSLSTVTVTHISNTGTGTISVIVSISVSNSVSVSSSVSNHVCIIVGVGSRVGVRPCLGCHWHVGIGE